MSDLRAKLASWGPFTALVVGDLMLDELVFGNADRLSPEAPVPILHVQRVERRAGGAANLCLNLAALGGSVHAFGAVGDDLEATGVRTSLRGAGVDVDGVVTDPTRPTTLKRRLIGLAQHRHPQMMFRVDHESRAPMGSEGARGLVASFESAMRRALASGQRVVAFIEDYAKGVCTPEVCRRIIGLCRDASVEVLVDPAGGAGFDRYTGCTAITPNRSEAAAATGFDRMDVAAVEELAPVASGLASALDARAVVLTLDRQGALLYEADGVGAEHRVGSGSGAGGWTHVPTIAREVYDVTGAGDMVIAALGAARANGWSWLDAVRLANIAAGLEVQVVGVEPIPLAVIRREVEEREGRGSRKLFSVEDVAREGERRRERGQRVVITNGCFDILHAGHLSLLKRAAALGDFLVVAVNSDASVRRLGKGPDRPVNSERDRAELLSGLECVGGVVIFDEDTPERVIEALRPDVLVKGAEYTLDQVPGAAFVKSIGGRVELLAMVDGKSTTGTLRKIRAGG